MAELEQAVAKEKVYVVKITYSEYKGKPTMAIGTGFKDMCFGQMKAKMLVDNIDAIREFAERKE